MHVPARGLAKNPHVWRTPQTLPVATRLWWVCPGCRPPWSARSGAACLDWQRGTVLL